MIPPKEIEMFMRRLFTWTTPAYRSVMLPAFGATTCGEVAEVIAGIKSDYDSALSTWAECRQLLSGERKKNDALTSALRAMVDRWEPDCSGQDRIMWENAKSLLGQGGDNDPE